ncbi:G-type lectin S-receptor-like serine/threonine-protein kinase LECRK4 [Tasmannia lanceolata]|uniref:G-type lectin S-receptor-like serine/threonine-protein kinase LECRK4 n=1 Tax=Tasmannia lanceolata TaxID=3420 RepID=UPI004062B030
MAVLPKFMLLQLLLAISFYAPHAQTQATNIILGSTLLAGNTSYWLSPSEDFAFGFYNLTEDLFLAGIWFHKIPEKTLVWSANRDRPVRIGSKIKLTLGGMLVITDPQGTNNFWIYNGTSADSASMQDDGNFVLRNSGSTVVWQSFDSPTDTMLPGQTLKRDKKLISNVNGTTNYSTGQFELLMQYDGNLLLNDQYADPAYWYSSETHTENSTLVFNRSTMLMYVFNTTGISLPLTDAAKLSKPLGDYYHRATIDDGGNFQQYTYWKGNGKSAGHWSMVWRAFEDPCTTNGLCGEYSYCVLDGNQKASCRCPQGFSQLDPTNPFKGCYPDFVLESCQESDSRTNFVVLRMNDADFPNKGFADLERLNNSDADSCEKAVMEDCFCMAAVLEFGMCRKKRMPLLNGRQGSIASGRLTFIKVPVSDGTGSSDGNRKEHRSRALGAGLITTSILIFLFAALTIHYYVVAQRRRSMKPSPNAMVEVNLRAFTFQELHEATDGFTQKLGRGGFGTVYSGILMSYGKPIGIAVKQLEKVMEQGEKEFMTELRVIGRTHHKNLVQLLGFCKEGSHRLLVYELMKNGSLSSFLFTKDERPSWGHRAEVAFGVARGLLYLHEECETQIIHCDIKPQNVLLDDYYTAKIADFGLAKLLMKDQTRTSTNVRGTMGYMAPEWLRNAPVTAKVDIYSFGIMLLEIICCRRHIALDRVEEETDDEDLFITDWVLSCMRAGELERVVGDDKEALDDFKRFERMASVGLWCANPDPTLRPSMKRVMQMLEGTSEVGMPPLLWVKKMLEGKSEVGMSHH